MYLTYTRHTVKDYAQWRRAFDANVHMLESTGVQGTWVVQVEDNPNDIVIINTWPSKKHWEDFIAAHKFTGTEDMVKAREKGGVIGDPEWFGGEVM